MIGIVRTCLIALLGWVAAGVALHLYLTNAGVHSRSAIPGAIGASFCLVIAVNYVIAVFEAIRERSLLAGAISGAPLADGKWVAVIGPIRSRQSLRAPISGGECVAYDYRIWREEPAPHGGTREVTVFDGNALSLSTINSRQGPIQLLAVPRLDMPMRRIDVDDALEHALAFIEATPFETSETPKEKRTSAEQESLDDDGLFRKDRKHTTADPLRCHYDERSIIQGETVCVFGRYSRARAAIVPHPNFAERARVMRGDAIHTGVQMRALARSHAFVAIGFFLAAFGVALLYTMFGVE